ncbi:hypothetical protein BJY01DRAFT_232993 [Aspergillus pseudoustus]|uniref:Coenzyme Q-binding protein COQ10 START domain-containing protein n=1 Tax=Aspergillus pseudoustus TaxID=1810923 RepID=A0ABR4KFZ0_9EURO
MMRGVKATLKLAAYGTSASLGAFFVATRKNVLVPLDPTDAIFQHRLFCELNPANNPSMHDVCVRRIPISHIRPGLVEKEGGLVEAFCAGVWSGWGYELQRAILEKTHRDASTQSQLWSREELRTSTYHVGTLVTDHFEVVEKSSRTILMRSGDSPRNQAVREVDGLFEMSAVAKPDEGVVEFGLKTCFFQGLGKTQGPPVPAPIEWLHRQYVKLLMESALQNVTN